MMQRRAFKLLTPYTTDLRVHHNGIRMEEMLHTSYDALIGQMQMNVVVVRTNRGGFCKLRHTNC